MKWNINKSRPICPQICEQICVGIKSKEILPQEKIYSVRELAVKLGVNPNTVQKSFDILEEHGVIYSVRGSGWYVSEDVSIAENTVERLIKKTIKEFIVEMENLGVSKKETLQYLNERYGETDERTN